MLFLEYAIWGAWAPVLAAYLLGGLKFSGKQTAWIYATLWIACIISPLIGGQIADRWMPAQYFLAVVSILGGILLLVAAKRKDFVSLLVIMFLYSLLYAPTLNVTNAIMFEHARNVWPQLSAEAAGNNAGQIRVWGTLGWIIAGVGLTLWRTVRKSAKETPDSLILAGVCSIAMGMLALFLPNTPPKGGSDPWAFLKAFEMLKDPNFLVFLIISFIVTTELQFYYVPTASYLQDIGVKGRNVPAVMTIAQVAELIGMTWLLKLSLDHFGIGTTLAIGVLAWPMRYIVFAMMKPKYLVIASLAFHGIGYTFFFFAGQQYVDKIAPQDIRASAQALIFIVTLGLGNFVGTQFTGIILDTFKTPEGKFRWRPIFLIPCALTVVCAIAFILFFHATPAVAAN
jgi:nucleoside transporter